MDSCDLEILSIVNMNFLNILLYLKSKRVTEKKVKKYSSQWLLRRETEGFSQKLLKEIECEDTKLYRTVLRMTPNQFGALLEKVQPYIGKEDTNLRKSISAAERLQVTLKYLATGETQTSLQIPFRMQQSTISKILKETIPVIYNVLKDEVLKFPQNKEDWLKISNDFYKMWGFPNCIGAIDGKHCKIKPLKGFASNYWCYKGTHSFVLMAIVDANYKFVYVDVGVNGRIGDAGIWLRSDIKYAIEQKKLHIPDQSNLPATNILSPYTLLADDAFPLTEYIMKPFSQTNLTRNQRRFNYMLSRNRRVVENAFGVLANRFQVLFSPIFREPNEAIKVVLACICLHNYLRNDSLTTPNSSYNISAEEIDSINSQNYDSFESVVAGAPRKTATSIRKNLELYFEKFYSDIELN